MDPVDWAAPRIAALARGRVLDLGCGDGRFLSHGGIGVDIDLERLRVARTRSPLVVRADAHALPFGGEIFDTVFANRMLNAAGRIDDVLREIVRILRPDGSVVVLTRARPRPGDDRLDPENGEQRLALHFAEVIAEREGDSAIFVARKKRVR
jgi:ubiquinone/menaquinone biosynthesis C-methylase UbiE